MDYIKVSVILALLLLPGVCAQNITMNTTESESMDILDEVKNSASGFKQAFRDYISYDILFAGFIAAIIYAIFAKGSVGAQSGLVQLAFVVAILFFIAYFFL